MTSKRFRSAISDSAARFAPSRCQRVYCTAAPELARQLHLALGCVQRQLCDTDATACAASSRGSFARAKRSTAQPTVSAGRAYVELRVA